MTNRIGLGLVLTVCLGGCEAGDDGDPVPEVWELVHQDLPGALLSVWGTSADDVWAVGADTRDGLGPTVLHFDGEAWQRIETGQAQGNLWWVFGFEDGPIYMGGDGGVILRYREGEFEITQTPGSDTVFGIWGASEADVWAVGGASESTSGFAWRLGGNAWSAEPSLSEDLVSEAAIWKVFGTSEDDVWLVGGNGVALHWDGTALAPGDTGVGTSLFTVHARDGRYAAVGGNASGIIVELDPGGDWRDATPEPPPPGLAGVTLGEDDRGIAVGMMGSVHLRNVDGWSAADHGFPVFQNLHGSWIDDDGGMWAVGGRTLSLPLTEGVMIHHGQPIASEGM